MKWRRKDISWMRFFVFLRRRFSIFPLTRSSQMAWSFLPFAFSPQAANKMYKNICRNFSNVIFVWIYQLFFVHFSRRDFKWKILKLFISVKRKSIPLIEFNFIYYVRFNTCVWGLFVFRSALWRKERDLNNNRIHNIFRLALYSHPFGLDVG